MSKVLLRQQLESLVQQYGVRGLVDTLAGVLRQAAREGRELPYDVLDFGDSDPVDPDDLRNAANALEADLW